MLSYVLRAAKWAFALQEQHKTMQLIYSTTPRSGRHGDTNVRKGVAVPTTASVSRNATSSNQRSIRLTVKAPPSKLREVTMGSPTDTKSTSSVKRESLSRGTKNKPTIVEKDEDDDEDTIDFTRRPSNARNVTKTTPLPAAKPSLTFRIPKKPGTETKKPSPEQVLEAAPKVTSVEEKEMSFAESDDDDELSELDDEDIEPDQEQQEDDDSEEEDEDEEDAEGEEASDSDEEMSSPPDALLPSLTAAASVSGAANLSDSDDFDTSQMGTPDPSRLTRRQRGGADDTLIALTNEASKKKIFTAEEQTMRKKEMARRRKDMSEKREKEEREGTLRKLLEKAPPKKKKGERDADVMDVDGEGGDADAARAKVNPVFIRTIMSANGTRIGVPEEWAGKLAGALFDRARKLEGTYKVLGGTAMVQEIE